MEIKTVLIKAKRNDVGHSNVFALIKKDSPAGKIFSVEPEDHGNKLKLLRPINFCIDLTFFMEFNEDYKKAFKVKHPEKYLVIGYLTDEKFDKSFRTSLHVCRTMAQDLKIKIEAYNDKFSYITVEDTETVLASFGHWVNSSDDAIKKLPILKQAKKYINHLKS